MNLCVLLIVFSVSGVRHFICKGIVAQLGTHFCNFQEGSNPETPFCVQHFTLLAISSNFVFNCGTVLTIVWWRNFTRW